MKTKDLILQSALEFFNTKGFEHASTYDIAKSIGISQGNLTYHFPTKRDLVNVLAKQMIAEIDNIILEINNDFSLKDFYENLEYTFSVNLKYPFLYMNYSQIVLNDEDLNDYFIQNSAGRKKLLRKMLITLEQNDYIKKDSIIELNDHVADAINMIAIYWVPESAIYHKNKSDEKKINHHLSLIFLLFKPYLTAKGEENIEGIFNYQSASKKMHFAS